VIAIGTIEAFGGDVAIGGFTAGDMSAYRMALAVGVCAAALQILLGLLRGGVLGEFFPLSAVHGMLAAIGVIIIVKQIPVALGVDAKGEPLEMMADIPHYLHEMNPAIALIGLVAIVIMFAWPWVRKKVKALRPIPAPVAVLAVAIPMELAMHMATKHTYSFAGARYELSSKFLVNMPDRVFGMFDYIMTPDFSALAQPVAWKWVFMFFMIGSLESILSAKAVDLIDPWKRKTNLDRDILAVGCANLGTAMVGGLPVISEIVRSKANIDNGARTRFADLWHGLFLLVCVALIPMYLHLIPLAALAAMLVYTGFRLAHPSEFAHVYRIGKEQLIIFVVTLVAVLATDLLVGIAIGMGVKLLIHLINGVPVRSVFKPYLDVEITGDHEVRVEARHSAIFTNWILMRRQIVEVGIRQHNNVTLDMAGTRLVDHSVMNKLRELESDFADVGLELRVVGLDSHAPLSAHELSARKSRDHTSMSGA